MSGDLRLPALDPMGVDVSRGTDYPMPFKAPVSERVRRRLGPRLGLRALGVNITELPPGAWSSQRHWHTHEEEFIYVLDGEVWLVSEAGEQCLSAGMTAGFPAGVEDGHHLVNRGAEVAVILEIGTRHSRDVPHYPDIDLAVHEAPDGKARYVDRQGRPY